MKKLLLPSLVSMLFLLGGCGEESGTEAKDSEKQNDVIDMGENSSSSKTSNIYNSEEDLPNCTTNRENMIVQTEDDESFVCKDQSWNKLKEVVSSICKLPTCDADLEGAYGFVKKEEKLFQCTSEKWLDETGTGISSDVYVDCFIQKMAKDSVESEDDLMNCTESRNGSFVYVGNEIYLCDKSVWAPVEKIIADKSDMTQCYGGIDGEKVYIINQLAAYTCLNEKWTNGDQVLDNEDAESSASSEQNEPSAKSSNSTNSSNSTKQSSTSTERSSSSVKVSSSSTKASSSSAKPSSSVSTTSSTTVTPISSADVAYTTTLVGPSLTYGYLGFLVPIKITAGTTQKIYIKLQGTNDLGGNPQWANTEEYGIILGNYSGSSLTAGTEAYSVNNEATYRTIYEGTVSSVYAYTDCMYKEFSFKKAGTWLENLTAGEIVNAVVVFYAPGSLYSGTASIPIKRDYYSVPAGTILYYSLTGDVVAGEQTNCSYAQKLEGSCSLKGENTIYSGETRTWQFTSLNSIEPVTYNWTFTGGDITSSTEDSPSVTYHFDQASGSSYKKVQASITLNAGLSNEKEISCVQAYVYSSKITGCTCGSPELVSSSDDISEVDEVSYKWTITGCKSSEADDKLEYSWGKTANNLERVSTTMSYTSIGSKKFTYTVKSSSGDSQQFTCEEKAVVKDSKYTIINSTGDKNAIAMYSGSCFYADTEPNAYNSNKKLRIMCNHEYEYQKDYCTVSLNNSSQQFIYCSLSNTLIGEVEPYSTFCIDLDNADAINCWFAEW